LTLIIIVGLIVLVSLIHLFSLLNSKKIKARKTFTELIWSLVNHWLFILLCHQLLSS
jgi:protein-S-isoprenylcysteine O-methyltransferase Ste14